MDTNDRAYWREIGVTNWAHDSGLEITQYDGRYTMWSLYPLKLVLDRVELDEIEHYIATANGILPWSSPRSARCGGSRTGNRVPRCRRRGGRGRRRDGGGRP